MKDGVYLIEMGKRIKSIRLAKKLSLPVLSKMCGIDMSNLWFLENGRRNTHILTLKHIADILRVDVKEFIP